MRARDVLFIGSTPKGMNVQLAYRHFLNVEGRLLQAPSDNDRPVPAIPLFEDDPNWVEWQLGLLELESQVKPIKSVRFDRGYFGTPFYLASRLDPDAIDLRFARRVKDYYPSFVNACREYDLNESPRLQVGINTLDLAIFAFWGAADKHYPAMLEATRRELAEAWEVTHGNAFFLLESPLSHILGNLTLGHQGLRNWFVNRLVELVKVLPEGAGWGLHLCNGDLDHRSVFVPRRMQGLDTTVWFANTFLARLEEQDVRYPELVQMPLARGKQPPSLDLSYYDPLRVLRLPDKVKLHAGLVHEGRPFDQLATLLNHIDQATGQRCGISNSCGFGRMNEPAMQHCLDLSIKLALV